MATLSHAMRLSAFKTIIRPKPQQRSGLKNVIVFNSEIDFVITPLNMP